MSEDTNYESLDDLYDRHMEEELIYQQANYVGAHHYSDCSLHNAPHSAPAPCDCNRLKDSTETI